jgi:negative regulator of flagellin synthesis FlgM
MKLPGDSAVPSKITGVDTKPVRVAPTSNAPKRHDQAMEKAGSSADSGSNVRLTGAARSLAALEQSLHTLPAVDEQRVAAVKRRLESGEYQIDPQRVADKLLHMENELRRGNPLETSLK